MTGFQNRHLFGVSPYYGWSPTPSLRCTSGVQKDRVIMLKMHQRMRAADIYCCPLLRPTLNPEFVAPSNKGTIGASVIGAFGYLILDVTMLSKRPQSPQEQ